MLPPLLARPKPLKPLALGSHGYCLRWTPPPVERQPGKQQGAITVSYMMPRLIPLASLFNFATTEASMNLTPVIG